MKFLEIMLFVVLSVGIISCEEIDDSKGVVMKFQTLNGTNCGLILSLTLEDEFRNLDPLNIEDFDISPANGLEVIVEFEESENVTSECEFAEPITITNISLL